MKRWAGLAVVGFVLVGIVVWGLKHLDAKDHAEAGPRPIPVAEPAGPAPHLIVSEEKHDFGTMDQQTTGTHVFKIGNEGPGTLELGLLHTTCACTSVKLQDVVWKPGAGDSKVLPPSNTVRVEPGQEVDLEVAWDTQFRTELRTSVKLRTNDPDRRIIDFFIEGHVVPYVEVSERHVTMVEPRTGQPSTATVYLYTRHLDELEVTGVESSTPLVTAAFEPADESYTESIGAKKAYKGTLTVGPDVPIGNFGATLAIKTNCPQRPDIQITIGGKVEGEVILTPHEMLDFKYVKVGEGATLSLLVKVRSPDPVTISVERVLPEFLKEHVQLVERGKNLYLLKVTVPRGAPGGAFKGLVELQTTHATAKLIKIPVRGDVTQ